MPHNLELVLELIKVGLAYKVHHTSARGIPLAAQIKHNKFKAIIDGFVKSPFSVFRIISLSLQRTISTPYDTKFARLETGAFYFAIQILTFYEFIIIKERN